MGNCTVLQFNLNGRFLWLVHMLPRQIRANHVFLFLRQPTLYRCDSSAHFHQSSTQSIAFSYCVIHWSRVARQSVIDRACGLFVTRTLTDRPKARSPRLVWSRPTVWRVHFLSSIRCLERESHCVCLRWHYGPESFHCLPAFWSYQEFASFHSVQQLYSLSGFLFFNPNDLEWEVEPNEVGGTSREGKRNVKGKITWTMKSNFARLWNFSDVKLGCNRLDTLRNF